MVSLIAADTTNGAYSYLLSSGDVPADLAGDYDGYTLTLTQADAKTGTAAIGDYEYGCLNKPDNGAFCWGTTATEVTTYSSNTQNLYWISRDKTLNIDVTDGTDDLLAGAVRLTTGVTYQTTLTTMAAGFSVVKAQPTE